MARILVVDYSPFMRKVITDALKAGDYEIAGEASNGYQAVARFQELHPDLTTLDITLPDVDGLVALRVILALDATAKVIMCSALGGEDKVVEAIRSGAKDFVVKPLHAGRLLEAVAKAFV
ncbi:MAG: response regulator [Solirubrobacteraceae bacterium]